MGSNRTFSALQKILLIALLEDGFGLKRKWPSHLTPEFREGKIFI